jgi:hypothetical protein
MSSPNKTPYDQDTAYNIYSDMTDLELENELINTGLPITGNRSDKENRLRNLVFLKTKS